MQLLRRPSTRLVLGRLVATAAPAASTLAASTSAAVLPRFLVRGWASGAGGAEGVTEGEVDASGLKPEPVGATFFGIKPVEVPVLVKAPIPAAVVRAPTIDLTGLPVPAFVKKPPRLSLGLMEAIQEVKAMAKAGKARKFDETVEIAMNLGVDPKRSDQNVRGMAVLPHGVGKTARVAVFARGKEAEEALAAGADVVGAEDLVNTIKAGGALNFDRVIGHPSVMPILSQIARILGPKGLMPNPKLGTMTSDIAGAVRQAKMGQVEFRADKTAIVHAPVGKVSFDDVKLLENVQSLITTMMAAKPKTLKGSAAGTGFIKKVFLTSTMGRSIRIKHENVLEMQQVTRK